jgi:hypothetical protein
MGKAEDRLMDEAREMLDDARRMLDDSSRSLEGFRAELVDASAARQRD